MTAQPCYTCTPADATNSVPALTQPREAFAYLVIAAGQTGELRTWVCGFVQHRTMHQLQATKALVKDALSSSPHPNPPSARRSEEHTSELQSRPHLVCRLLLEK